MSHWATSSRRKRRHPGGAAFPRKAAARSFGLDIALGACSAFAAFLFLFAGAIADADAGPETRPPTEETPVVAEVPPAQVPLAEVPPEEVPPAQVPPEHAVPAPVREALLRTVPGIDARIVPVAHFLTGDQRTCIREHSGDADESVVIQYVIERDETPLRYGYVDTHRVRTLSESVLFIFDTEGTLRNIEVLSFAEPAEYLPHDRWYAQFAGRSDTSPLKYGREIDAVTGATLTGRATVDALNRVSAVHRCLPGHDQAVPSRDGQEKDSPAASGVSP